MYHSNLAIIFSENKFALQNQTSIKFTKTICTPKTNIITSDTMELSDEMWKEFGYVKSSKNRTKVMKSLDGETKIPTQIAKDTEILQNHISSVLKQLREHGLVECINPEARKGRLYRLTGKCEKIVDKL